MRIAVGLLTFVSAAVSCWAPLELGAALAESDLVVVATLERDKKPKPGFGTLRVHKVLAGKKPKICTLRWLPENVMAPSGVMRHHHRVGQRLVYLLKENADGSYGAGHPTLIQDPKRLPELRKALMGPLYRLTLEKYSVKTGRAVWAVLEIRTVQPKLTTDRWLQTDGDVLERGGLARLALLRQGQTEVRGKVRQAAKPRGIVVTPDKPHRVRLDLRRYFDLKPDTSYRLWFGEGPQRRSRVAVFRIVK